MPTLFFLCAALCFLLSSASPAGERRNAETPAFASFRDIPGVTPEEIAAVETLRREGTSFLYGTMMSTELFRDENGELRGFTALLCEWLTELFEMPFETRLYEWDEMIRGLETGEIDFTGELTATPERRKNYLMTDAIAERLVKRYTLSGGASGGANLAEVAKTRPLRYAFLEGVTTVDEVRLRAPNSISIVFVADYPEACALLKSGAIDAFIEESTGEAAFDLYDDVVAEDFFPLIYSPVSLATQKQRNAPVISIVQKAIQNGGMRRLTELYNRGLAEYARHKLAVRLTPEEKAWIRTAPVIKFVAEHDNYPVSFYNGHDGEFQGVFFDALRQVADLTGLRFERINTQKDDWSAILGMLERGEASMISELIRSPEREGRFLWPEVSLMTDYYALLSKTDLKDVNINEVLYMRIGLVDGYAHTEIFRSWFPGHADTALHGSFDNAFDALSRGEIDMIMGSRNQLQSQTNFRELSGYKANIVFDYPYNSLAGFHKDETVLRSVVDKAARLVPMREIAGAWMRKTYDYRVKVAQSRLPWLIGATALLFILFYRSRRNVRRMHRLQNAIMETVAEIVEYRDGATGGHIERTSRYLALLIGTLRTRGLFKEETSKWDTQQMVLSAQLHDVGKVAISDAILCKPGALTPDEFEQMKRHTVVGGEIIEKMQTKTTEKAFLEYAKIFALHHHERWDGSGYPSGMKGTEIPLAARLMAIIDVYDALLSDRPYKKAFAFGEAVKILAEGKGTHFDPVLVDVFLDAIDISGEKFSCAN